RRDKGCPSANRRQASTRCATIRGPRAEDSRRFSEAVACAPAPPTIRVLRAVQLLDALPRRLSARDRRQKRAGAARSWPLGGRGQVTEGRARRLVRSRGQCTRTLNTTAIATRQCLLSETAPEDSPGFRRPRRHVEILDLRQRIALELAVGVTDRQERPLRPFAD